MRRFGEGVLGVVAVVVGLALLAGLGVAAWKFNWFVTQANVNRQAHVIRQGYSNQQTLREQITQKLADVQGIDVQIAEVGVTDTAVAPLRAQRHAIASIVCQDSEQVSGDPLPADQASWISTNCSLGSAVN